MASKSLFFMAASGRGVTSLGGDIYMTHFVNGTAECALPMTAVPRGSRSARRISGVSL
jgi:hypothetical protein